MQRKSIFFKIVHFSAFFRGEIDIPPRETSRFSQKLEFLPRETADSPREKVKILSKAAFPPRENAISPPKNTLKQLKFIGLSMISPIENAVLHRQIEPFSSISS